METLQWDLKEVLFKLISGEAQSALGFSSSKTSNLFGQKIFITSALDLSEFYWTFHLWRSLCSSCSFVLLSVEKRDMGKSKRGSFTSGHSSCIHIKPLRLYSSHVRGSHILATHISKIDIDSWSAELWHWVYMYLIMCNLSCAQEEKALTWELLNSKPRLDSLFFLLWWSPAPAEWSGEPSDLHITKVIRPVSQNWLFQNSNLNK